MISYESELYKQHSDWVIKSHCYSPIQSRNQLVLDLSNPKVCEYLTEAISEIFEGRKYYLCEMGYEPPSDRSWEHISGSREPGRAFTSICVGTVLYFGTADRIVSGCTFWRAVPVEAADLMQGCFTICHRRGQVIIQMPCAD